MSKPDKKEIARIIQSYIGNPSNNHLKKSLASDAEWIAIFAAIDFFFLGGIGTGLAMFAGGISTLTGISNISHRRRMGSQVEQSNTAGQTVEAPKIIHMTLEKMEKKLSRAFENAVSIQSTINGLPASEYFATTVNEVRTEVEKLSPMFNVVAGNGFGTVDYKFIVETRSISPGVTELVTVEQAQKELETKASASQKKEEEKKEIDALRERLEALENPRTFVLDKKPTPRISKEP